MGKSVYDLLGMIVGPPTTQRPFSETLMIPQWRTERILRQRLADLGVQIEYGVVLTDLDHSMEGVLATLATSSGEERLRFRYLIGADGARSLVRKAIGIRFAGEIVSGESYVIADVRAEGLSREYWMNWSMPADSGARVSMCPLPHSGYFQFVAPIPADRSQQDLSLETLQKLFDERCGWRGIVLSELQWIARHIPNARLADHYRAGSVFLVGDAAHSPPTTPGQGLNLSVQDSYNLGWKLAAVLGGDAATLLDTYEKERRPVTAAIVGVLAKEMIAKGADPETARLVEARIKGDVFNLKINYGDSPLAVEQQRKPGLVRAGDRAPNAIVRLKDGTTAGLFDLLQGTHFTALWLNAHLLPAGFAASFGGEDGVKACLAIPVLPPADEGDVHSILGGAKDEPVLIIIRPDGYVALRADDTEAANWNERLTRMSFWSALTLERPSPFDHAR